MKNIHTCSRALVLGLVCLCAVPAAAQTLESTALRLEVTAQPRGFRLIERSTGDVLVEHARTVLASGTGH